MRKLKHTWIMAGITVLLLVIVELVARLIYPIQEAQVLADAAFEHDSMYQIRMKPHIKKQFIRQKENGGDTIIWRTNSLGLRGAEPRTSDYRIVVYGDSNVQGRFSANENTYAQQLAQLLTDAWNKDVEVLNAGIMGFGPDQAFLKFQQEAEVLQPNLVILTLFADNDYGDLLRNRLFELDEACALKASGMPVEIDGALLTDVDQSELRLWAIARKLNEKLFPKARVEASCDNEEFKQGMLKTLEEWEKESLEQYEQRGPKKIRFRADYYDYNLANYPELASSKLKLALMKALLQAFKKSAEAKGIDFVVVILPSAIDMTESNYFMTRADFQKPDGSYNPKNLSMFMEQICTEEQIDFINLYDPFFKNDPATLYFRCLDNHWNDKGQRLAAEETTNFLVNKYGDGLMSDTDIND